ncbi:hypothetical protein [Streptomyces sp. GS7]|uniref:hypothetical protein n=1 Tax=Streptomyces sp. GS7 TaxID=2692234 RepID=UPI00131815EC|nr:hypothetical protein [Streptomyces sp. GS7]QHC25263.1 hypothetical protein GR130_31705 [Streptomyces sp. GS7]
MDIASLMVALAGVLASGLGIVFERLAKRRVDASLKPVPLDQRVQQLGRSMRESARLIEQVTAELEARSASAQRLKEEAESAQVLAKLQEKERKAVADLVKAEIEGQRRRTLRDGLIANAFFFVGGGLVTLAVALFVHPIG